MLTLREKRSWLHSRENETNVNKTTHRCKHLGLRWRRTCGGRHDSTKAKSVRVVQRGDAQRRGQARRVRAGQAGRQSDLPAILRGRESGRPCHRIDSLDHGGVPVTLANDITQILDSDCDETRVALYNMRSTVAKIRERIKTEPAVSVDEALRVLNHDYWDDVRGIVDDLGQAIRDGEITDEESFREYLDEITDGHQRVIYTHQARLGLCFTNNADA